MQELDTKAASTKSNYIRNFKKFLERWNLSPDELYELRVADKKSEDTRDHKRIERMVKTQMKEHRQNGYAASSCGQIRKSVLSFYESQGLEVNLKSKDDPSGITNGQRVVTIEQIRQMCDRMVFWYKLRNQAIVLSLKDTGLRISDLGALNVGQYLSARVIENNKGEQYRVFLDPVETIKMKEPAYVHFGPESIDLIDQYLQQRRESGEVLTLDRPLFATAKKTKYALENGGRLSKGTFTGMFGRLKKYLDNNGHKISAHSLRKFHRTRLEGAGMPEGWVKKLQGKKASVYSQPEENGDLTEKYVECYHALRIFGKEQEEITNLNDRLDKIERMNELLMVLLSKEGNGGDLLEQLRKSSIE